MPEIAVSSAVLEPARLLDGAGRQIEQRGVLRLPLDVIGWLFCGAWAAALFAFPMLKHVRAGYLPIVLGTALGVWIVRSRARLVATRRFGQFSPAQFLVICIALAAALRVVAVAVFPLQPMVDDAQFHRYALSMLAGTGYGAPGYRAWFPPGMSFALFAWYAITTPSPLAGKILNIVISCGLVWQTWATARQFLPENAARVAAFGVAVFPTLVFYTATLGYELLLALILLTTCRLAHRATRDAGALTVLGLGLVVGAGALVNPICLLVPPVLGLGWWLSGMPLRVLFGRAALVGFVVCAVVAPWTIRNYRVLHAFVPVSTNGGYTLYSANNPKATGLAMPVDPIAGESDEVSRDHLRMRAALHWMATNPWRSIELAIVKTTYTWGTSSSIMSVVSTDRLPARMESACKAVLNVAWSALFVLCGVATARSAWSRPGVIFMTLLVAYVFALHLVFEALSRYQVPVVPFLLIVAATGLVAAPASARVSSAASMARTTV